MGIPNFKHFILKRLPDAANGRICWILTQAKGERPWFAPNGWDYDRIRETAAGLPVGEATTLIVNHSSPFIKQSC